MIYNVQEFYVTEEIIMPYIPNTIPFINPSSFEIMLSAKTFDIKKLSSTGEFKLCVVPTFSQLVEGGLVSKAVIPEVLNYLRYNAAIRALHHNCIFIDKAININDEDLDKLSSMSFDYRNSNLNNGVSCSNRRINISPDKFYQSSLIILRESKDIIQNFCEAGIIG